MQLPLQEPRASYEYAVTMFLQNVCTHLPQHEGNFPAVIRWSMYPPTVT